MQENVGGVLQKDGSLVCGDCGCLAAHKPVMHASRTIAPGDGSYPGIKEPPPDDDCHCHVSWRIANRKPATP